MRLFIQLLFCIFIITFFISGCAQKVTIKALEPAEISEMATKKQIAISEFKNDRYGLSGKIESQIAKHKLDKKRYFSVVSRKDLDNVISEQRLQSSELMDEATSTRVGRLIGAQVIINGEIALANATADKYIENRKDCLQYYKDGGCARYKYYKVVCNTVQASVSANINIVDVETASLIYGDTITKEYSADSCKMGQTNLGLLVIDTGPKQILSRAQALNRLTTSLASEFVNKLIPHYIYFDVILLDNIELDEVSSEQEKIFENSLAYIKAGRMDKAERLLQGLLDELNGKSYVVAYVYGVVNEAIGNLNKAKKLYTMADDLANEPIDEINLALVRIDELIAKRQEIKKQTNVQ